MKKNLAFVFLIGIVVTALHAHEVGEIDFGSRIGLMFGLHGESSTFSKNYGLADRRLVNFNLVFFGSYTVIPHLTLQGEFNIMINQGMEWKYPGGKDKIVFTSIDIPVLAKYAFLEDPFIIGAEAGIHFSIPMGTLNYIQSTGSITKISEHDTKGINFGISLGAFGEYRLGPGRIVADMRFIFDFTRLQAKFNNLGGNIDILTRRGFNISVGYSFIL